MIVFPFDYTALAVSGKVERSLTGLTTPGSGVAVVTPTDRPKSVRNRCVIEVLVAFFFYVVALLFGFFFVGVGAFVIGLSQIPSFFSLSNSLK